MESSGGASPGRVALGLCSVFVAKLRFLHSPVALFECADRARAGADEGTVRLEGRTGKSEKVFVGALTALQTTRPYEIDAGR
jgi:hypothetical protein